MHGDFNTKKYLDDSKIKHYHCTTILDFSGKRKYKYATDMTQAYLEFKKVIKSIKNNEVTLEEYLERLPIENQEGFKNCIEKNFCIGYNYHFQDFEKLTGTLTIIGLAPQNDNHIFSCINQSNIDHVVFYHYFGNKSYDEIKEEMKKISLPIEKPYTVKNVNDLWNKIKISSPKKRKYSLSNKQLEILNAICPQNPIAMNDIIWQLNSIPSLTKDVIQKMLNFEIPKDEYHTTPTSEKELCARFIKFGKTLDVAAISPQVLYYIYFDYKNKTKNRNKK